MRRAFATLQILSRQLLAHETRRRQSTPSPVMPVVGVCDKLHPPLATLMGRTGYRALLLRALTLAGQDVPWLQELTVEANGSLTGFLALRKPPSASLSYAGQVVLLTHLLGLLVTFIGEKLTWRLIHDIWPKLNPGQPRSGKGIKQ